jgi:hypothetical protein
VIAKKIADGKSDGTIQVYRQKLGHFLRLAPNALLSQVDPDFVDGYVSKRRTEEVSDHTISKEVTHLLTVLKAAKRARQFPGDVETLRPDDLHAGYKPQEARPHSRRGEPPGSRIEPNPGRARCRLRVARLPPLRGLPASSLRH